MQNLDDARRTTGQRAHLEAGIYRKKIGDAYFDTTTARMDPDECIREAINEAALSLLGNRSVELRGLNKEELAAKAWERIRNGNGLEALHQITNFGSRSKQVIAVVTRCVTDVAFEFWQRQVDVKTATTG